MMLFALVVGGQRAAGHLLAWLLLQPSNCQPTCICSIAAPASLLPLQAQRDFFGSHTYQRIDKEGWFHTVWDENFGSADSITTSGYVA